MSANKTIKALREERDQLYAEIRRLQDLAGEQPTIREMARDARAGIKSEQSNDLCAEGAHEFVPFRSECVKCGEPYSTDQSAPVERDELRIYLEAMCKLWPSDLSDDGSGRMRFKPEVVAVVKNARAALKRKPS